MTVLPDTSVWIDYLRHGRAGASGDLDRLLEEHSVLVCGPVAAELIAGTPPEHQEELWITLSSLPWSDLDAFAWREVGLVAGALRRTGRSVPLTDVAIAVACTRAAATLWTRDDHFDRLAEVLPALGLHGED